MTEVPAGFPLSKEAQTGRPWTCQKDDPICTRRAPCRSCLGRRSRRGGLAKQRAAARALGVPSAKFHGQNGNEESWRYAVRIEVKSGAQVGPIATRYLLAEKQSEQNRAVGDGRAFMMIAMPRDWASEGLAIIRLSALRELLDAQ
jgi:hypothetical protein